MKRNIRETNKIKELANEYKDKGYDVLINPQKTVLPIFLQELNYQPDLIIKSETENIIIEVKTSESIKHATYLERVSQAVEKQKGWELELVLTNPRKPKKQFTVSYPNYNNIISSFERAKALIQQSEDSYVDFSDAALLLAMASLEGAMRYALSTTTKDVESLLLKDLIRNITIQGLVSREDYAFLLEAQNLRNSLMHGNLSVPLSNSDTLQLIEIGENLMVEV